jgi:hypothetical protein
MTDDKDFAAFEAEFRRSFTEWLDAEWRAYLARNPDGTPEGFRAHVRGLADADPDFVKLFESAIIIRRQ